MVPLESDGSEVVGGIAPEPSGAILSDSVIDDSGGKRGDKPACKPDSVPRQRRRPSIWGRCCHRPRAIYPQALGGQPACADCRVAVLLDLAPGGVCRATAVTCGAGGLLHHRFTLTPLSRGGLLSVALSRGSPRVGVTHHPALWSPDFPRLGHPAAAARPACQLQG